MAIARTTVHIDTEKLHEAAEILGTDGIRATVDAALTDVVRRHLLAAELQEAVDGKYDAIAGPALREAMWRR